MLYREAYPQIDIDSGNPELSAKLGNWELEKTQLKAEIESLRTQLSNREELDTKVRELLAHPESFELTFP